MPTCKKCKNHFPNRWKDSNGKVWFCHTRKYCLECSPIGTRHFCGPSRKDLNLLSYKDKLLLGWERSCKTCGRIFKHKTTNIECSTCRGRQARQDRKKELVDTHGGSCIKCGYNKSLKALEFHHLDPKEKLFNISACLHYNYEDLITESSKCILLCANCHREIDE